MATALVAPIIITMRPFAKDFNTGFGLGGEIVAAYGISRADATGAQKSGGGSRNGVSFGSRIASRFGLASSKGGSMGGSALRSMRGDHERKGDDMALSDMKRLDMRSSPAETSESVKGLTRDVIMQTTDVEIQYEDSHYTRGNSEEDKIHRGGDRW
jgi:hypothetical protein